MSLALSIAKWDGKTALEGSYIGELVFISA
jgi:hypothetical protein